MYPPRERMGVIVAENFPALGRLAALRFLEWVRHNPDGVVSLPTGKTPEYFIRWVNRFLSGWDKDEVQRELEKGGLDPALRPDMRGLHFVQIDEFYPIDPAHHNSFYYYVHKYYIGGFGLDAGRGLFIDCTKIGLPDGLSLDEVWPGAVIDLSLRHRHGRTWLERLQKDALERVDQWCMEYEERIRSLGGIGFFLGGIGPDGHIAFNMRGSDHHSTTRLAETNYETQAAAAIDLGGIEIARKRHVITIGLSTITFNGECAAIIIAAGEAKARLVREAVEEPADIRFPATALHALPGARFYVTAGAAKDLDERSYKAFVNTASIKEETIERIVLDIALKKRRAVSKLERSDFMDDRYGAGLLSRIEGNVAELCSRVHRSLCGKIEEGGRMLSGKVFLHTSPHHDDDMLGYLPYAVRNMRTAGNTHVFAYMTSGFNAVTNGYALSLVERLGAFISAGAFKTLLDEGYFAAGNVLGRMRDVWQYLDGVAAASVTIREEGESRRMLRCLMEIFEDDDLDNLTHRIDEIINYFKTQYPGKKDPPHIQRLKGMIREWEADCLWGYLGFDSRSIHHLRLGFYQGELFTEEPLVERDVMPIVGLLRNTTPDIVTVAFDPESSGPDTHYKVLQAVAEALRIYEKESGRSGIEVIGYRNVWFRFHPAEANVYIPVSLNMFAVMQNAFENAFGSQRTASFPSYEHDGTFAQLAQRIQTEQYQALKTCIGREFFYEHPRPLIRATRGFVYLKRMTLAEFYAYARELRKATEAL